MSLKPKIEAVIYAAEEPVTLAQLVSLLGEEAQAELDRAAQLQAALPLDVAAGEDWIVAGPGGDPFAGAESAAEEAALDEAAAAAGLPSAEPIAEAIHHAVAASQPEPAAAEATADPTQPEAGQDDPAPSEAQIARAERARMGRLRVYFRQQLEELKAAYADPGRGLELREIGGGYRLATKPECHDAVRGFVRSLKPPLKLSLQALETLAVVAYKQPVTAPEVSEIRGVDSGGVLGSLISRKLVQTAGRKQVIGRPILYKTTREFLLKFGLRDVTELPSIEEFEKMAGQMTEQEEMAMDTVDPHAPGSPAEPESPAEPKPQRDAHAPQADGDSTSGDPLSDETAPADNLAPEDKAGVDGRLSSLPPDYSTDDDPSAQEAAAQEDQASDSGERQRQEDSAKRDGEEQ